MMPESCTNDANRYKNAAKRTYDLEHNQNASRTLYRRESNQVRTIDTINTLLVYNVYLSALCFV